MAQLKITSKLEGLSPSEMQETAARYPYEDDGEQLDGDALDRDRLPLNRRTLITPDDKVWSVGSRQTAWTDPRTAGIAKSWQKRHAIEQRKGKEGWKGDVRAKRDGSDGPEYDRMMLSLSKVEAAELGPDGVDKVFREFIEGVRQSPYGGTRMVEVEPIHTDTDHLHMHVNVHRHGYDLTARTISRTVWMPEIHTKEAQRIAEALPDDLVLEYVAPGSAASRASDEARQGAAEAIREAGGSPSPDMTGEGRHAVKQVLPTPELERITEAQRDIERRMAARQQEQQEDAALLAKIQHAASAMQEAAQLRTDLAVEQQARATVEAAREAAQAALDQAHAEIATVQADAVQAAEKAAQEATQAAEVLLQEQNRADQAERLAGERFATIEDMQEVAKGEPERVAMAVAAEVDPLRAEVAQLRADLDAERQAREVAVAELAEERRTFVDRATKWAEENLMGPVRKQLEEAQAGLARAEQVIKDQAAAIAAIPERIADAVRQAEERMAATIKATVEAAVAATRNAAAAPFIAAGEAIRAKTPHETFQANDAIRQAALDAGKSWGDLNPKEKRASLAVWSYLVDGQFETDSTPNIENPEDEYAEDLKRAVEAKAPKALPAPPAEPLALPALDAAPEAVIVPAAPRNTTWRTEGVRAFADLSPEEKEAARARLQVVQAQGRVGKAMTVEQFTANSQAAYEAKKKSDPKF